MGEFEQWFADQDFYTNMRFIHGDNLFSKDGDVYRVLPVQMTYKAYTHNKSPVSIGVDLASGECSHISTTMFHDGKATCFNCDEAVDQNRKIIKKPKVGKSFNFDSWNKETDSLCPRRAFEAGQQSMQSKIEQLEKKNKKLDALNLLLANWNDEYIQNTSCRETTTDAVLRTCITELERILRGEH